MTDVAEAEPPPAPDAPGAEAPGSAAREMGPRLARHLLTLDDGHQVGVAVCGQGVPVVLVHGFTAEGILYAQTLARLVRMGFRVVAVDVAGHGGTQGLPTGGDDLTSYVALLGRVLDRLGIGSAVLAGHSLGGRLVAQLAATEPERAMAVVLIDACVGDTWDRVIGVSRFVPPLLVGIGVALVADTLSTLPVIRDPRQALKLGHLVMPTLAGHALRPWRMLGPAVSLVRSAPSKPLLQDLAAQGVPTVVIHGDRDLAVPYRTARDAARDAHAWLVTVHGGTHSWVLKDPGTLPGIAGELLDGPLGALRDGVIEGAGLDPAAASVEEIEELFLAPDAEVRQLTPPWAPPAIPGPVDPARYRWTIEPPGGDASTRPGETRDAAAGAT
jgi:pimeloyl-ACP methyl ester carboxylesterase